MRRRLSVFLTLLFSLLSIWFLYLGWRLFAPLAVPPSAKAALWAVLSVPFAFMMWIPAVYWRRRSRTLASRESESRLLALGYLSLAYLSFLFFTVVARDLVYLATLPFIALHSLFTLPATLSLIAAALIMVWLGYRSATGTPRVREVRVPIADLPDALHGFRLAQVSDVHVGRAVRREFVAEVVERVNALEVDLIAITGDLVDGTVEELRDHVRPLEKLVAREGAFYVTGNHEYYWGAAAWIEEVRSLGIRPLLNSHHVIERTGTRLVLAGITDLWASRMEGGHGPDAIGALAGAPDAELRVLLAHQPLAAKSGGAERFHLQLSGHTHGGQFLPWTFFIRFFQPFVRGLIRYEGRWIYVNPGTGYWGPPVRLGSPSEITLLTLEKA